MRETFDRGFLSQVKGHPKNNIAALLADYCKLIPAGKGKYKTNCINPEHPDRNPSMIINEDWNTTFCFSCQSTYDPIGAVQVLQNVSFVHAVRLLAERAGIPFTNSGLSREALAKQQFASKVLQALETSMEYFCGKLFSQEGTEIRNYLKARGIKKETAVKFKLGWCGNDPVEFIKFIRARFPDDVIMAGDVLTRYEDSGRIFNRMANRLVIPLLDEFGKCVGFAGRVMVGESPKKYVNSKSTICYDKSRYLYGLNNAKRAIIDKGEVILTEGYFDVMTAWQEGFMNIVSCSSNSYSKPMMQRLRKLTDRVIACMDRDKGGRTGIRRIHENSFNMGFLTRVAVLPQDTDVDSFLKSNSPNKFLHVLETAMGVTQYRLNMILERKRRSEQDDVKAYKDCIVVLAEEPERMVRNRNIPRIAKAFSLHQSEVKDDLMKAVAGGGEPQRQLQQQEVVVPGYVIAERKILAAILSGKGEFVKKQISPEMFVTQEFGAAARIAYRLLNSKTDERSLGEMVTEIADARIRQILLEASAEFIEDDDKVIEGYIETVKKLNGRRRFEATSEKFVNQVSHGLTPQGIEDMESMRELWFETRR